MKQASDRLIIFDHSGTLSPGGAEFARPERLLEELKISGLHELGIETPELFWEHVVNPTWEEGSTTPIGYKKIICRQVARLFPGTGASPSEDRVLRAVSLFVDRYLEHSRIDEAWRPLLQTLSRRASAGLVIATDHYAEATGAILEFLRVWQIPAVSVTASSGQNGPVLVANSADLGVHKADRRFWEAVRNRLSPAHPGKVLLVDDFGANEQESDAYAGLQRVEKRRRQTVALLKDVFGGDVQDIFFRLGPMADPPLKARRMEEVSRIIGRFLEGS
jgi:hypothetical protein